MVIPCLLFFSIIENYQAPKCGINDNEAGLDDWFDP